MEQKENKIISPIDSKTKILLNVEHLNMFFKVRGSLFKAINDISFKVNEGDFFGIIGESGSGKSTTGKSIIKLYQPSGGKIEIDGHLISNKHLSRRTNKWLRKNVQMIFQDPMASLNPTKNILQIVSEPLVINRSMIKKTYDFFKKISWASKYFHYEFLIHQEKLNFNFKKQYLIDFTQKISNFNLSLQNILNNNAKNSYQIQHKIILDHYDDLSANVQNMVESFYKYVDQYKELINNDLIKYEAGQFNPLDYALDQAIKKLHLVKKQLKYSIVALKKMNEINVEKNKIKKNKIDFKEGYKLKNFGYIKSWELTVLSQIKLLKQDVLLANNNLDQTFYKLKLVVNMHILHMIKFFKKYKCKYLEESYISEIIKKVTQKINYLYEDVINIYIEKTNNFEQTNLKLQQKVEILNLLPKFVEIAKLYYRSCTSKQNLNYDIFTKTWNVIFTEVETKELFNNSLEKIFNKFETIAVELFQLVNNAVKLSEEIFNKFKLNENENKKHFFELKKEYKNLVKIHKEKLKDKNYANSYINSLNDAKNEFLNAKRKRTVALNNFLKNDWMSIKKQKIQNKLELKKYNIVFHQQIKLFNKLLIKASKQLLIANNLGNKNLSYLYFVKNKELLLRSKSIQTIRFEYKKAINETNLYKKVYTYKPIFKWLLFFNVVNLLKRDSVYKALDSVGLKHEHAYRYPHEFSGGQRQRIVIARALITNPKLIIADEPISALDVSIQAQVINILKSLAEKNKITVLFIAHDLSMVNYVCNRVIIMHQGRILEYGDVDSIFNEPIHPYTRSLLKATPKLSRVHVDLSLFDEKFVYDNEWKLSNEPKFISISDLHEHYVFGLDEQVEKWKADKWIE